MDHRHPYGVIRREFLQVGFSGLLGLGLPGLLAGRAAAKTGAQSGPRAKAMILVFTTGGLSHLDTLDMKPEAPEGIRGEFRPIATKVPGLQVCEHLPGLAARADKLAVVRSLSHEHTNHLNATHQVLTGHPQPGAFFDKIASRDDYPCYAGALEYLRPRQDGLPSGVLLPTFLMEGPLIWPGQHAGFLGPRFDPWQIKQDPNKPDFRVEELSLPAGFSIDRLGRRKELLDQLNALRASADSWTAKDPMAEQRELALSVLLSGKVTRAFEIDKEDPRTRDRYGRHLFGQSLLLARRLVEAGVPIVQANMGRVQTWDTHSGNFKRLKDQLLPPLDRGLSALLDDLEATGRLDETLVVLAGEFGRTPRIGLSTGNNNTPDGRDHWSRVFSVAFAGAGVRGGQVIGQSDRIAAYPASRPYSPQDFAATIYRALGIDPATELRDRLNRPIQLSRGQEIAELYTGARS
ncbi:MAG: DUF1501 domain-containing protein [Isosphaeraceae bacterium]|nr:DUF1501 domain-containing protein [Isosphaeraceae bacterium]